MINTLMKTELSDGFYRVETDYLTASFVVEGGRVIQCASILKPKLAYWLIMAKKVSD